MLYAAGMKDARYAKNSIQWRSRQTRKEHMELLRGIESSIAFQKYATDAEQPQHSVKYVCSIGLPL